MTDKRPPAKPRIVASHDLGRKFRVWLSQQKQAIDFSLKRLWFNPISAWITLIAIALALSLPTSMHVLVKNLQSLTHNNQSVPTISLFLKPKVTEQQANDLAELVKSQPEVLSTTVVTRDQALQDFKKIAGLADTLKTLGENPLPNIVVITPKMNDLGVTDADLEDFTKRLKTYKEVEDVQIDIEWIQRLRAILQIAERIVAVVAALLATTVLLVVGNTIRLDIENRKDEIRVTRLIGATNRYIRRPFLYGGLWLGLFGGFLSLLVVNIALLFLVEPVNKLSLLYGSDFNLGGIDLTTTLEVLIISASLGLVGAWLAVNRYLWESEVIND
ncbi:permease-like cell division protein FtsX [uncultured Thiothrix sp.]|uniref:permease-like cell division protein FtsX n=1 Tax=uncultured Thiothrix sp. TaxID=223185 RepID=UPI0026305C4B|nr:permease-like cell division protein FtsX [uncultured Thiothrix sp.]HMT91809.1 permease-like cell division protein FtsX [Thiolinea sp.]